MDKKFASHNFLFDNETGARLFGAFAERVPIYDFHTHLSARLIADDHRFQNLTELTLSSDHYKWRAMRIHGVGEDYITGSAPDREKFLKWAETVPFTLGNPLFHWVHLELSRVFGIDEFLNGESAGKIYDACAEKLRAPEYSIKNLLRKMNVKVVCTTDDPLDALEYHDRISRDRFEVRVLPGFRADNLFTTGDLSSFNDYIDRLADATGEKCDSCKGFLRAVNRRLDYFHERGCRIFDLGLDRMVFLRESGPAAGRVFKKIRRKKQISGEEKSLFQSALLEEMAGICAGKGWALLLHIGPIRNVNTRAFMTLGPDSGFDAIGDFPLTRPLADFLDALDRREVLPRTVVYTINPREYAAVAALMGCFPETGLPAKVQFGAPWWFCDHRAGIEEHLEVLSQIGLLRHFIGMVSDSRSFLSFCRHEYFRRILCNLLGRDMEKGLLPDDEQLVGSLVSDICFFNAKNYFTMKVE